MNWIYVCSGPCLSQSCKSIKMKWLLCILLSASVVFISVDGEGSNDCTYAECSQLLASLNVTAPDYCVKYDLTEKCVNDHFQQCGEVNADTAVGILTEFSLLPECTGNVTDHTTSTPVPTPARAPVDCTYTECSNLFHALNTTGIASAYCAHLEGVYDCLNTTSSRCPHDGAYLLNHDTIKMELDSLQLNCVCPPCDGVFNALTTVAPDPSDDNYCELYVQVEECIHRVNDLCSHDDSVWWPTFFISKQFDKFPRCNYTNDTRDDDTRDDDTKTRCINGTLDKDVHVKLNDDLPSFTDNDKAECTSKHMDSLSYCGMYGHSHLRSFNSNELFTCSLPGHWAMFNHQSLRVTVLNAVTNVDGPYTVVDEVTVLVPASDCSQEATYHASVTMDQLPITFEDGTSGVNGLESILNSNATSVYIRIPWISTVVAVHKLGRQIGIVIQSPESVANRSVGLCSLGCPEHSKVAITEVLDQDGASSCMQEAIDACAINDFALFQSEFKTKGEHYYDKCLFDVLQSNHSNSAWISLAMANSWHLLGPTGSDPYNQQITIESDSSAANNSNTLESTAANNSNTLESTLHVILLTCCLSLYAMLHVLPS